MDNTVDHYHTNQCSLSNLTAAVHSSVRQATPAQMNNLLLDTRAVLSLTQPT